PLYLAGRSMVISSTRPWTSVVMRPSLSSLMGCMMPALVGYDDAAMHRGQLPTLMLVASVFLGLSAPACGDDGSAASGSESGSSCTGDDCETFGMSTVAACPEVIGEEFCSEGAGHVDVGTVIEWMHDPPHSGPHYPVWAASGEHDEVVERGYWVHNLEHGAIV